MSVKEADMKTRKEAMTCCQGDSGGNFSFVGLYELELK